MFTTENYYKKPGFRTNRGMCLYNIKIEGHDILQTKQKTSGCPVTLESLKSLEALLK